MIQVITSNPVALTSIKDYCDNFVICHMTAKIKPPTTTDLEYNFKIYYQDGMELDAEDEYQNSPGYTYEFIPSRSVAEIFEDIAKDIAEAERKLKAQAESADMQRDEIMVACACDVKWNRKASRYLNTKLNEELVETNSIDIYQHFRALTVDKLVQIIKYHLNTEFVYPEDPIAFAYALYKTIGSAAT